MQFTESASETIGEVLGLLEFLPASCLYYPEFQPHPSLNICLINPRGMVQQGVDSGYQLIVFVCAAFFRGPPN